MHLNEIVTLTGLWLLQPAISVHVPLLLEVEKVVDITNIHNFFQVFEKYWEKICTKY